MVNLEKSKVMIFKKGGGRYSLNKKRKYNGEDIERENEYKYLGLHLTSNSNVKGHLKSKVKLQSTRRKRDTLLANTLHIAANIKCLKQSRNRF